MYRFEKYVWVAASLAVVVGFQNCSSATSFMADGALTAKLDTSLDQPQQVVEMMPAPAVLDPVTSATPAPPFVGDPLPPAPPELPGKVPTPEPPVTNDPLPPVPPTSVGGGVGDPLPPVPPPVGPGKDPGKPPICDRERHTDNGKHLGWDKHEIEHADNRNGDIKDKDHDDDLSCKEEGRHHGKRFTCVLDGPGKALKVGVVDGAGLSAKIKTACMSERACLNLVSKKFKVKAAVETEFCEDDDSDEHKHLEDDDVVKACDKM